MDYNFFIIWLPYYRNNFKCVGFLCMRSCSDTGNMQLLYNSPGGYLVHVLLSQCVYFPINGPGRPSGKPRYCCLSLPVSDQWDSLGKVSY